MAISAVISLVTIISIYRESGILKRLRATPLRPQTILSAHVLVKLLFTAVTLSLMMLAGRRLLPGRRQAPDHQLCLRAAVQHAVDPVDWFRDCQPGAHGALRAAGRRAGVLSDDRAVGPVRAGGALPSGLQMVAQLLPMTYIVSLLQRHLERRDRGPRMSATSSP